MLLPNGRQTGLLGGGGGKALNASGDPERLTLLYPEPQTSLFLDRFSSKFWMSNKSYKSVIKNRRLEKLLSLSYAGSWCIDQVN